MEESPAATQEGGFRWRKPDLIAFTSFFVATVILLPVGIFALLRLLQPGLRIENLSGVQQILIQALMDLVLVAFISFLVKIHNRPILRTLHFIQGEHLALRRLVTTGALLALAVLLVSSFFPTPSESPLEKLLTTTSSVVVFVVFGVAVAPLIEEIIFRGFLFTALADVYGPGAAVPVTAILFAALHVSQLRGNWPAVAVILFVGYVLTVIRKRTDSVIPSVIVHTTYNSMIFGISALVTVLGYGTKQ